MKILSASAAVAIFSIIALNPSTLSKKDPATSTKATPVAAGQKIQAAILLDVSNSMDGLIEQAKAQLWNMVSVMGKAKCETGNPAPTIEIALYEYGRSNNDVSRGYVKQVSGFTSDLDQLSQELFKLTTDGGDEYCGQVIYTSLDELKWDAAASSYKVIFIAGNEDFLQGNLHYTKACNEAKKKGVIVNAIYCGDKLQGIAEHWNLVGECGNGSFTYIDQDAKIEEIPTPYDSTLITLNNKLNETYMAYGGKAGKRGEEKKAAQGYVDRLNDGLNFSTSAKRISVKASVAYGNVAWDLVDAYKADSTGLIKKLDLETLPDSLRSKDRVDIEKAIKAKAAERAAVQKEIINVSEQRAKYIAAEKAKAATDKNIPTLETEVEKIIKTQVKRFNMRIE